jgi:gliding motility-associated-like protein
MLNYFSSLCRSLALVPMLFYTGQGIAQSGRNFTVGESSLFAINPVQGTNYYWKVAEDLEQNKDAATDNVTYLTAKHNNFVQIKWGKAGLFFLTVTGFNENGCSNSKVFPVNVVNRHNPVANDDYNSTDWLKSVRINLLDNDHDPNNDLDVNSLKIITKPEYGEIIPGKNGSILYNPLRNKAGTDYFHYVICDSCIQCDTAMVTITVKDPPLFLPQGISPNGDGVNDRFVISGLNAYPRSSLTIFSRDGIVIFYSDDYKNDWNGMNCNQSQTNNIVPAGTYYYLLQICGSSRYIRGFLYLIK